MSVDMSLASPTSTLSAWDALQPVLAAERATRLAAVRRELDAQPARPRTVADVQADIARFTSWLKLRPVRESARWYADVDLKLQAALAELNTLTGGTR